MRRWSILACLALVTTPATAAPRQDQIAAFRDLVAQDLRLASIGYRLAAANRAYCPVLARNPGWVIHDIAQYPDSETAKAAFNAPEPVSVAAVVPSGPAAQAGLLANDGFSAILGQSLDWTEPSRKRASYDRLAAFKAQIAEQLRTEASLPLTVNRGGQRVNVTLAPPEICASDFQIDTANGINAGADGQMVSVSIDLVLFAENEIDLAAVVAHELAHNLLQHRRKLDAAKVKRGFGGLFGKSKNAILQTEIEADQLSIWLLHNAGYDTQVAIAFWQRYAKKHGTGIFTAGTHLRWKNRIAIMQAEIVAIANAQRDKSALFPPLLQKMQPVQK
jgi:beta-barrel assembly-enhancing protease